MLGVRQAVQDIRRMGYPVHYDEIPAPVVSPPGSAPVDRNQPHHVVESREMRSIRPLRPSYCQTAAPAAIAGDQVEHAGAGKM